MSRCRNEIYRQRKGVRRKGVRHLFSPLAYSVNEPGNGRKKEPDPSGLTLVEMLVAMAITLVMMAAVVNLFANVGASVRNRRATIEMSGQLRLVRLRLHNDLVGATCPTLTWQRPGDDNGYLEIVEGPWSDKNPSGLAVDTTTSLVPSSQLVTDPDVTDGRGLGDYDDIIALTARSESEPFVGRGRTVRPGGDPTIPGDWIDTTIESTLGEVIWFAVENPVNGPGEPGMRTVYRRALLVAPWSGTVTRNVGGVPVTGDDPRLNLSGFAPVDRPAELLKFQSVYDISVRLDGDHLILNTLGDLTKRENRYGHVPTIFPHIFPYIPTSGALTIAGPNSSLVPLSGDRLGEDVMLSDVLSFDVRVYDPGAQLVNNNGVVVEPPDVGWRHDFGTYPVIGYGAFVDLNYWGQYRLFLQTPLGQSLNITAPTSHPNPTLFSGNPSARSMLALGQAAVYDTWSFHYENDGLDQDNDSRIDQGTNGLDDNNQDGVDDMGERETAPPYDVPLRGIQVKLRVYEPDTRNIRETTVTRNFVP